MRMLEDNDQINDLLDYLKSTTNDQNEERIGFSEGYAKGIETFSKDVSPEKLLADELTLYIKLKKTPNECVGFIEGYQLSQSRISE